MKSILVKGILVLIILSFSHPSLAGSWTKIFDLNLALDDSAWNVQVVPTTDNGYAIAYTNFYFYSQSYDLAVIKVDDSGNLVWKQVYNLSESMGSFEGFPYQSMIATNDNGLLVWGTYCCSPNNTYTVLLLRLNEFGEALWQKTLGETESDLNLILFGISVIQNASGNFWLAGLGYNRFESWPGSCDGFWTAEIDGNGNLLWENFQQNCQSTEVARDAFKIIPTSDGGMLISGWETDRGDVQQPQRAWVSKYNSSGSSQWQKDYDSDYSYDAASILIPDHLGNYYVGLTDYVGTYGPSYVTYAESIAKINGSGSVDWHKKYGLDDYFYAAGTPEGELILASRHSTGEQTSDIQLSKIDGSGEVAWSKTINILNWDDPQSIIATPDGGFLVAGITGCDWRQFTQLFLLKLDNNGNSCFVETAQSVGYSQPNILTETPFSISPFSTTAPIGAASTTITTSTSSPIQICTSESINGKMIKRRFAPSQVCGGPPVEFEIEDDDCGSNQACINERKVLISKKQASDTYISPYQTEDRIIKVWALVKDGGGQPLGGQPVYFRVNDPPDTAPYVIPPTPYVPDNKHGLGVLAVPPNFTDCTVLGGAPCVVSNNVPGPDFGKVMIELEITPQYAGDNYQLEASFEDFGGPNPSPPIAGTSGIITAWKRVYIENDNMYRKGGILVNSFNASTCGSNCKKIKVYGCDAINPNNCWTNVQVGDSIKIFDEVNLTGETRTITAITTNADTTKTLTLNSRLNKNYVASDKLTNPLSPFFRNGHSAGIGVPAAGYYEADFGNVGSQFNDAFVDVKIISGNSVPYLAQAVFDRCFLPLIYFHQIWFEKKIPKLYSVPGQYTCNGIAFNCPNCGNEKQNYFHVIAGSFKVGYNGFSIPESDSTYVMIDVIQGEVNFYCNQPPPSPCNGNELSNYVRKTSDHELVHQFKVNWFPSGSDCDGFGHDHNIAWCGNAGGSCISPLQDCAGTEWCNMNNNTVPQSVALCQRIDGIDRLDCNDLAGLMCPGVVIDCAGNPPDSIRTHIDPE